jgi:SAM-dependent methyltransferase
MTTWYNEDLAYIHDVGFRDYALKAMPGILELLRDRQLQTGVVVELGCGSGLSAEVLYQAGYQVLGIDISGAMISIAQTRVPSVEFRVASLFTAEIPACNAVISIGECLNYTFDLNSDAALESLFQRIYQALSPGGVFLFDAVVPGQVAPGEVVRSFTELHKIMAMTAIIAQPYTSLLALVSPMHCFNRREHCLSSDPAPAILFRGIAIAL